MTILTYNQVAVPSFMYGTAWKKDATTKLVEQAVEAGFKAIDTANQLKHYDEKRVGDALRNMYGTGLRRDSLFLQTKFTSINGQDHRTPYDTKADLATQVKQSMESSLNHLNTDYIDSYVLHGPQYVQGLGPEDWEVWAAIEELYQQGKAKVIGVSNVSANQLNELCAKAKVKPMVVQNRCFAVKGWDRNVRTICDAEKIVYQGFSLLTANPQVMADARVQSIAKRCGTGVAQIIFRFSMQIGMLPLTGTTNPNHMKEDLAAESLTLTDDEVRLIETIDVPVHPK